MKAFIHSVTVNETVLFISHIPIVKTRVHSVAIMQGIMGTKKHVRWMVCGGIDSYWAPWEELRPLIQEMWPLRLMGENISPLDETGDAATWPV